MTIEELIIERKLEVIKSEMRNKPEKYYSYITDKIIDEYKKDVDNNEGARNPINLMNELLGKGTDYTWKNKHRNKVLLEVYPESSRNGDIRNFFNKTIFLFDLKEKLETLPVEFNQLKETVELQRKTIEALTEHKNKLYDNIIELQGFSKADQDKLNILETDIKNLDIDVVNNHRSLKATINELIDNNNSQNKIIENLRKDVLKNIKLNNQEIKTLTNGLNKRNATKARKASNSSKGNAKVAKKVGGTSTKQRRGKS